MNNRDEPLDWDIPDNADDAALKAFVAEVTRRFQKAIDQAIAETAKATKRWSP